MRSISIILLTFFSLGLLAQKQVNIIQYGGQINIISGGQVQINNTPMAGGQVYDITNFTSKVQYTTYQYYQPTSNGDLIDYFNAGPDIPYVSGDSTDQIFDFSVLSDERFNKNGQYYTYPWDEYFYYDTNNSYHWKLKDFHYRKLKEECDSTLNFAFGKLNYNASVLNSTEELLIDIPGVDDLASVKNYIGISASFFDLQDDLINGRGAFGAYSGVWTVFSNWTVGLTADYDGLATGILRSTFIDLFVTGDTLRFDFEILNSSGRLGFTTYTGAGVTTPATFEVGTHSIERGINITSNGFRIYGYADDGEFALDNVKIYKKYWDYYNNEYPWPGNPLVDGEGNYLLDGDLNPLYP